MAFDAEEYKRRRQARLEQRQQKAKQQRHMLIRLLVCAAALVLCGVLIFVIAGSRSDDTPGTPSTQTSSGDSLSQDQPEQSPTTVIHFAATGDLNVTDSVVASGGGSYDYTNAFLDIAHLLADADITAVNLEGTLVGAPYGSETASAPSTLLQTLRSAGVDMIQLANSYSISNGTSGLAATIRGVQEAGMEPLGVYATNADFKSGKGYTLRNVKGVKIAFVAFTKGMDGLALPAGSEDCVNVLYTDYASTYQTVDTEGITEVLQAAAKEKPDITIALLHWGSEFNDTISQSQKDICALMQANGVDAIIGTHSHYVQQMVFNESAGTFVAYSLGDFFGDAQRAGSEYSVILDLEITKDNGSGNTRITNFSYTPIFTVAEEEKPLRIVRIDQAIAAYESGYIDRVNAETYSAMKYALERIDARIQG